MAETPSRRSRLTLAALVGASAALAAGNAAAQQKREGVQFEVGVTGGAHFFSKDSELGVPDDPMSTGPNRVAPAFGLRFGVVLHPMFAIELEGLGIPTKDRLFNQSLFIVGWHLNLVYNIAPGQIAGGHLVPFVLVGGGGQWLASVSPRMSNPLAEQPNDNDSFFYGGAGLKYELTDLLQLRIDGRAGA